MMALYSCVSTTKWTGRQEVRSWVAGLHVSQDRALYCSSTNLPGRAQGSASVPQGVWCAIPCGPPCIPSHQHAHFRATRIMTSLSGNCFILARCQNENILTVLNCSECTKYFTDTWPSKFLNVILLWSLEKTTGVGRALFSIPG